MTWKSKLPTLDKQVVEGRDIWSLTAPSDKDEPIVRMYVRYDHSEDGGHEEFMVVLIETGDYTKMLTDKAYDQHVQDIMSFEGLGQEEAEMTAWNNYRTYSWARATFGVNLQDTVAQLQAYWNGLRLMVEPAVTL